MWALKIWPLFKLLDLITFYFNMIQPQKSQNLLIIYLALQHCLQNPNAKFQYWDMSHQMTRWTDRMDGHTDKKWTYFLVHMPYFRRPGHISMIQYSIKALISVLLTEIILVNWWQICILWAGSCEHQFYWKGGLFNVLTLKLPIIVG